MDKITRKTSFGQWFSAINFRLFEKQVESLKSDLYTKKLTTESFLKLMLFAQAETNSKLKVLKISRYLRATLWKPAYLWLRRIEAKSVP
ncbi:hypothetical protein Bsel_2753 [[Bacillus] selenitireducens MLS10]|uniref:DUF4372 domain-containing protein n=1 Tax=Bacillus selenitireducens (strain ATCC 700615 / DSM 15326 / MLS10) TaxID=439292 RepID=D6XYI1_BACIE|nr:hypothetical protein Bsel_2753 [[Bacillus] selenitireducens MLS10]